LCTLINKYDLNITITVILSLVIQPVDFVPPGHQDVVEQADIVEPVPDQPEVPEEPDAPAEE